MSTRIDGVNVTVFDKLDVETTVYVGGNELALSDIGAINRTDHYSNLTELAVERLFFDGIEVTASGGAIPATFRGTRLTNVNVIDSFAIGGQVQWAGDYTQAPMRFTAADPDYLSQSGNLGAASSVDEITLSVWFELASTTVQYLMFARDSDLGGAVISVRKGGGSGAITFALSEADGTQIASVNGGATTTDVLYHLLASWSTTEGLTFYLNDVEVGSDAGTGVSLPLDVVDAIFLMALDTPSNFLNGCVGDFWFDDSYLDLSVESNRRKFSSSAGTPVELGASGEIPTGSQPLIFFGGAQEAADWNAGTNLGSGGAFTMTGAVIDCDL